ncbi:hypothetical protein K438DRAFT_124737 [Mycena galopus ATCC 62051]|nr:hypothetical protein K438DRAFT_124737 [Mycena galopus ATCC 62051]
MVSINYVSHWSCVIFMVWMLYPHLQSLSKSTGRNTLTFRAPFLFPPLLFASTLGHSLEIAPATSPVHIRQLSSPQIGLESRYLVITLVQAQSQAIRISVKFPSMWLRHFEQPSTMPCRVPSSFLSSHWPTNGTA